MSERKSPGTEIKSVRESDIVSEAHKIAKACPESKKWSPEDENENKVKLRKTGFGGGGFLGGKKLPLFGRGELLGRKFPIWPCPQVLLMEGLTHLVLRPHPLQRPLHPLGIKKKSDSSGQEYNL